MLKYLQETVLTSATYFEVHKKYDGLLDGWAKADGYVSMYLCPYLSI